MRPSCKPNWRIIRRLLISFAILPLSIARPVAAAPDIDDAAKALAPQAELDLLRAYAAYSKDIPAPNDIIRDEQRTKQIRAWRMAVMKIGNFSKWSASVVQIESGGRIILSFAKYLNIYADVPEGSKLFSVIRNLSDRNQLVYVSGHITETSLAVLETTDEAAPTCFEEGILDGCEVAITSIESVQ